MITEQLLLVRDNLFRGMSKSIQKLQARSINEVLELENFTRSPQRTWVGLTEEELYEIYDESDDGSSPCGVCGACSKCKIEVAIARAIQAKLKEKNNG